MGAMSKDSKQVEILEQENWLGWKWWTKAEKGSRLTVKSRYWSQN